MFALYGFYVEGNRIREPFNTNICDDCMTYRAARKPLVMRTPNQAESAPSGCVRTERSVIRVNGKLINK